MKGKIVLSTFHTRKFTSILASFLPWKGPCLPETHHPAKRDYTSNTIRRKRFDEAHAVGLGVTTGVLQFNSRNKAPVNHWSANYVSLLSTLWLRLAKKEEEARKP